MKNPQASKEVKSWPVCKECQFEINPKDPDHQSDCSKYQNREITSLSGYNKIADALPDTNDSHIKKEDRSFIGWISVEITGVIFTNSPVLVVQIFGIAIFFISLFVLIFGFDL